MRRRLTDHIAAPANEALSINVLDEPGQGGACYEYRISARYRKGEKMPLPLRGRLEDQTIEIESDGSFEHTLERIVFQNGPIKEHGVNGVTQEALLAIVIDRLRSFQDGPFRCRENAIALTHCEEALLWLQKRTRDRLARGVEGTNQQ